YWILQVLLLLRRGSLLGWRRLLTDLFEVVLDIRLEGDRDFVAPDFATALAVLQAAIGVGRAQLLAGVLHFHGGFTGYVLRSVAEQFVDFPHGGQIGRLFHTLVAIPATYTAAGLFTGLLRFLLAGGFAIGILTVAALFARLAFLRVALFGGLAVLAGLRL